MKTKEIKYILDMHDTLTYHTKNRQVLYRIIAMKDIDNPHKKIKKGERGGYVALDTLSQEGTCWVDEDSYVFKGCHVCDNSYIQNSVLDYNCEISDNALVVDTVAFAPKKVKIQDNSKLKGCQIEYNLSMKDDAALEKCQIIGSLFMQEKGELSHCIVNCYGSGLTVGGQETFNCMKVWGEGNVSDTKANIKKTRLRAKKLEKVL